MDIKRFFSSDKICGDTVKLYGEEFYHAVKVTRHKVGYKIIVCDNTDKNYYATVTDIRDDCLTAKIDRVERNETESDFFLTLFIGNNKDLDTVVQKAVELGVGRIVPFTSQHCNENAINLQRLEKIVTESSKQCGRSRLAVVSELVSFDEALKEAKKMQTLAFYEFERGHKVKDSGLVKGDVSVIIGCEGGFSLEEIDKIKDSGIETYTLGKRVLRVATAVVSACTLINEKMDG
jgi:16S rRNA (uracil1498-N3)-methyltransferase